MGNQMVITLGEGKRINASYGVFEIRTDQSKEAGGDASAPEPFDLFLASLGCCSAAYVRSFCDRREIPTDGIRIQQRWERNEEGKIHTIALDIQVPPTFPEKYRPALVRAASQCPVKRITEDPPQFELCTVVGPHAT